MTTTNNDLPPAASFSHGTLGVRDALRSQRFYKEFLGLNSVRKANGTQYVWLGGEWIIACLPNAKGPPVQGIENRWGLRVATAHEVDAAHAAALAGQAEWEIRAVQPVAVEDGTRSFCLQDLDGNWWEIYHRPAALYDDVFDRGITPTTR
jgi:catechol 2,3-dioxygenase-like lactoylglutathione lyase family enzyme